MRYDATRSSNVVKAALSEEDVGVEVDGSIRAAFCESGKRLLALICT
jgi:hypothetical protein